jgi:hypothetical protein
MHSFRPFLTGKTFTIAVIFSSSGVRQSILGGIILYSSKVHPSMEVLLRNNIFTDVRGAASNSAYYGYPELWI